MKEHGVIVIKDDKNRILFVKRSLTKKILPGAWSFPSGTVEENENVLDTVKREAKEELGVEIIPCEIFGDVDLPEFSVKLIFVLCKIAGGNLSIISHDEIDKVEWMEFNEFFSKFKDDKIGHGLVYLRKNPDVWKKIVEN
jgi:8-oxo-dGTP diphosphatase